MTLLQNLKLLLFKIERSVIKTQNIIIIFILCEPYRLGTLYCKVKRHNIFQAIQSKFINFEIEILYCSK